MFKDKVAWVIGASSGIGLELAKQLNAQGAIVIISARRQEILHEIKEQLTNPGKVHVQLIDLEDQKNFQAIASEMVSKFGRIDYLFNNGGISQRSLATETPLEIDRRIMEVNYFGNIALTKAVLPFMREKQAGHIVVISSIAGLFGFYLRSAYAASKHALQGFYESLLLEEEENNIAVTIAYPGKINTSISISAITSTGEPHGIMDHNQETGMTAARCATVLLKAVSAKRPAVLIGGKETKAVYLKRYFPSVFRKIIRKQKPT